MWLPNEQGIKELVSLFSCCNLPDNDKQIEIYNVNIFTIFKILITNKENKSLLERKRFQQLLNFYFRECRN